MLLFEAIVDGLPDAVVCLDGTAKIRYWNRAAEILFGFDNARLAANGFAEDAAVQSIVKERAEDAAASLSDSRWQQTSVLIQKQNGEHQSAIRMSRQISIEGDPSWRMVIFKNPSIEHFAEAELSRLARTDPLSELLNRRGFQASLESNLDRRLALAIIDVDFFKKINDQLGHEAGDNAIKWIAQKLRAAFPLAACIGRLGGDEFAVVLDAKNSDETKAQFEDFCAEVAAEPISWYPAGMTISIGVAIANQAGGSARELLTNADRAMYSSKQHGRNLVTVVEID